MVEVIKVDCSAVEPTPVPASSKTLGAELMRGDRFASWEEAWDWLEKDVNAQMQIVAGEIERLRSRLRRAEEEAAAALIRRVEITKRHEAWKKEQGK